MAPWKIRRGEAELEVPTLETLRAKARSGELKPEHYVFNPVLNQWLYAKDVGELADCYRAEKANHLNQVAWTFFAFALLFAVLGMGLLSSIAFLTAIGCAVAYYLVGGRLSSVTKAVLFIPVALVGVVVLVVIAVFVVGFGASKLSSKTPPTSAAATTREARAESASAPRKPTSSAAAESVPSAAANLDSSTAPELPDLAQVQAKIDDQNAREGLERMQRELDEKNGNRSAVRSNSSSATGTPKAQSKIEPWMVPIEYVWASSVTGLYHRKGCPDIRPQYTKVRVKSAEGQGIHPHSGCLNLPKYFEEYKSDFVR